jgi:hypothetical protein
MKAFIEHTVILRLANGEKRVVTRKWWQKFLKSLPENLAVPTA